MDTYGCRYSNDPDNDCTRQLDQTSSNEVAHNDSANVHGGKENKDLSKWKKILRTNGASKNLGFSFLIDPVLNDEFKNVYGELLTSSFFQGFKVCCPNCDLV